VQSCELEPEISCGFVHEIPLSLWVSMIGDSTYSSECARNAVQVT
jgi:hypothetical protein